LSAVPLVLILSDGVFSLVVLRKSLELLQQPMSEFIRQTFALPG
jgi:hypothetical protein